MTKKMFILLICIILITSNITFASSEKIYELKIKSTYYIYENELNKLNNNEENITVYSSLEDLIDNKETIIKKIDNESLMECTLFANSLDEIIEEVTRESRKKILVGIAFILILVAAMILSFRVRYWVVPFIFLIIYILCYLVAIIL